MKLIFIRHGDPNYELDCLTPEGELQAKALSEYFNREIKWDEVYSSPLGRAHLTAKACLEDKDIQVVDWLREFTNSITLDDGTKNLPWDLMPDYVDRHPDLLNADKWLDTPEMESDNIKEKYNHVIEEFEKILAKHGYIRKGKYYEVKESNTKTLVFFCHFGITSVIMSHLINVSFPIIGDYFCASPTSLTTLVTEERQKGIAHFRCIGLGEVPHLTEKGMKASFSARFCEIFDSPDRH